jgi:hypothetical protein
MMTRRNTSIAGLAVIVLIVLVALFAYRIGMHRAMSEARPAARGADGGACVDIQQAGAHANQESCVAARVLRVFTSKSGNTFLDFCEDYRTCPFTSIIFTSDRSKFGDVNALQGRQVELRGKIQIYHDQPEIVLKDPSQIREEP